MMKWKRGLHQRPESSDGRFYVDGHWDRKPGYYELVDTKTMRRERGTKLKDLKTRAEGIVASETSS